MWVSTQVPFDVRDDLAEALGVEKAQVRTIAPDVGGGFGAKLQVYPEYLAVATAAMLAGRPVRWAETRTESMSASPTGAGRCSTSRSAPAATARSSACGRTCSRTWAPIRSAAFLPVTTQEMLAGVYAIPRIASRGRSVVTNATPIAPYRGAGRPEATALIERALDLVAAELWQLDPAEVRRTNLIPADVFPYTTASGTTYDSGDYERALDEALRIADYRRAPRRAGDASRSRRPPAARASASCTYVEITSFSSKEFGSVEVDPDGGVTVLTGVTPHGQGHETAFAQIAAAVLGVPFDAVRVVHSDTGVVPRGQGTWGSRSLQAGGSAVVEQAGRGGREGAAPGGVPARGRRGRPRASGGRPLRGARRARTGPSRGLSSPPRPPIARGCPGDLEPGLVSAGRFRQSSSSFPFGAHVAVVEVDVETGAVRLLRHVAVDDCGRILNPMLVDGQVHGGLAQGIAQALFEEVVLRRAREPVDGTLTTYAMPSAAEFPWFETAHTETPTPTNPLGAKGIGESACDRVDARRAERGRRCAAPPRRPPPRPPAVARARPRRDRASGA